MTAAAAAEHAGSGEASVLFAGKDLCKNFGGVRAVRDVSLEIPTGTVFAIIGPNGAGKSTLLNLMSGIYQPDAGTMQFAGADLVGMPAHRRARQGLARIRHIVCR